MPLRRVYSQISKTIPITVAAKGIWKASNTSVSYTHLDVYKRQCPCLVEAGAAGNLHSALSGQMEYGSQMYIFCKKSEQRDVLLLGAFTVLGASLSHVCLLYTSSRMTRKH